jgi:hypothetical protein
MPVIIDAKQISLESATMREISIFPKRKAKKAKHPHGYIHIMLAKINS